MITKFTAKHIHFGDCIVTKVESLDDYMSVTQTINPLDYGVNEEGSLDDLDAYLRDLREYYSDFETAVSYMFAHGYVYLILCKDDVIRFDAFEDIFRNIKYIE
jgi:hypothetical protein